MERFRRKGTCITMLTLWLTIFMAGHSVPAMAGADRIYPTGQATLWRGDQKIGVYTQEAPLPEGAVISTEGRCAVKLDDLYLVAEDQSTFSINTTGRQRNVFVKQGIVYFKTAAIAHGLAFVTPNGQFSVQQIRIHAGFGDASLKGYLSVTDKQSELGVAEGGAMDVLTDDGLVTVDAGKKIILAQADMDIGLPEDDQAAAEQPPVEEEETGWSKRTKITVGVVGGVALVGIIAGLAGGGGGGGGGGGDVSPSSP